MKKTDESIVQVPVGSLRSFPNHPFRITDDESMSKCIYMDVFTEFMRSIQEDVNRIDAFA